MAMPTDISHHFADPALFRAALIHSSYANESRQPLESNERLEFLGDSVLSIVVSDYLFAHCIQPEGELTRLRASLVCEVALAEYAQSVGLGALLQLGRGEAATGGRERPSILADAFESVIAAVYLDGGLSAAEAFVLPFVTELLSRQENGAAFRDYKTMLQEIVQQNPEEKLSYVHTGQSGPDHAKQFSVEVRLNSNVLGRGEGRSKKLAEQAAAREALVLMGEPV